jgi:hypothetical protein
MHNIQFRRCLFILSMVKARRPVKMSAINQHISEGSEVSSGGVVSCYEKTGRAGALTTRGISMGGKLAL